MNRQYRRVLPLLTAAALAVTPMEALAENPQFAHDEATWERLKDNVMEYDELSLLVEEYNPNYQNEQMPRRYAGTPKTVPRTCMILRRI